MKKVRIRGWTVIRKRSIEARLARWSVGSASERENKAKGGLMMS